jgi:hypothetical protein
MNIVEAIRQAVAEAQTLRIGEEALRLAVEADDEASILRAARHLYKGVNDAD